MIATATHQSVLDALDAAGHASRLSARQRSIWSALGFTDAEIMAELNKLADTIRREWWFRSEADRRFANWCAIRMAS